jgi:formiminotetrahydrofolate cyclodeaminase
MPKNTPEEEAVRDAAIADATVGAAIVPLGVLEACPELIELNREVGRIGLQASLSDAGVGAQVARAAAAGAYQNVCINLAGLGDATRKKALLDRADAAWARTRELHEAAEEEILVKLREQA